MIMKRIVGNQSLYASTARNSGTPRIVSTIVAQEPPTLDVIAQSGMPQSLGLINVDGKNPWILDWRATDNLTGSSEQFVSYTPCVGHYLIWEMWFATFINDYTYLTWVYPVTDKSENAFPYPPPSDSFRLSQGVLPEFYISTRLISEACVFVGYPLHQRGYKYFHSPSRKYFVTIDVTFCEDRPYFPVSHLQGERGILERKLGPPTSQLPTPIQDSEPLRDQGTRSCTKHAICNYVSYDNLSPQFKAFTTSRGSTTILKNIHIALECPEWKNIVMEKMKALEKNNTWEICALPKGHKPMGCKWVFALKY
ncbi:reverse transcriptase [Cucumis melo var. makuwa]|uniref:Reverse transcriptase n=1 Tax=Cucumis melo var. makuwa TaxID=1194695 RepID=A0A5A7U7Z1_CUCMM|nr:reverse transcriptase [Cucumis melo var. makuwa]